MADVPIMGLLLVAAPLGPVLVPVVVSAVAATAGSFDAGSVFILLSGNHPMPGFGEGGSRLSELLPVGEETLESEFLRPISAFNSLIRGCLAFTHQKSDA